MNENGTGRAIVAVGASAVEALRRLVAGLPADLAATVVVVLHVPRNATSVLPDILARAGKVPVAHARDGDPIEPGREWCSWRHQVSISWSRSGCSGCRHARRRTRTGRRSTRCSARRRPRTVPAPSAWCCRARSTTALRACSRSIASAA